MSKMEQGRKRNNESIMVGNINQDSKLTDIYLPRKCDYTDRLITPKDHSSVQITVCELNSDGTINLNKKELISICGVVRGRGDGDVAFEKILLEKKLI